MTVFQARDEMAALEQARAQLEAALGRDENWLALKLGPASDGDAVHGVRVAMLDKALAHNPFYRAWKLVDEAMGALRTAETAASADHASVAPIAADGPRDDLTRIRGISRALAGRLAALGVTRYAQIAAWRTEQVRAVTQVLDLGRDISRQNWIEQAALLERRTRGASADVRPAPSPAPAALREQAAVATEVPTQPPQRQVDLPDILDHIRSSAPESIAPDRIDAFVDDLTAPPARPRANGALPHDAIADFPAEAVSPPPRPAAGDVSQPPAHADAADRLERLEEDIRQFSETLRETSPEHGALLAWEAPLTIEDVAMLEGGTRPAAEPQRAPMPEEAEATVTFVVRAPPPAIPSVTEATIDPGVEQRLPPAEPFPDAERQPAAAVPRTVAPDGPVEEAEVVIVRPDSAKVAGASDAPSQLHPAGSMRRLLKALTGT